MDKVLWARVGPATFGTKHRLVIVELIHKRWHVSNLE